MTEETVYNVVFAARRYRLKNPRIEVYRGSTTLYDDRERIAESSGQVEYDMYDETKEVKE